ncbi:MAG: HAD family phosphatase [Ruminococcus sp.]|nr:HAD family phosphatase [Candidatus Copronaster equi]
MKIKYAIFDVDGTLLDSMHIWDDAADIFLQKIGFEPRGDRLFRSQRIANGIDYMIKNYNLNMTPEEIREEINIILKDYYFNIPVAKPGVKDFLQRLKDSGAKLAIATATERYLIENALERNGLLQYFDSFFTTFEVGKRKHFPDIFNIAKDSIGGDETTVVFEDACYAIETVSKAGYKIIAVEDYSQEQWRAEIKKLADYYITDYEEIYDIVEL